MTDLRQRTIELLAGHKCVNFRFVEGGTLILYLEPFQQASVNWNATLWLECAWRLRDSTRIMVGSLDDPDNILDLLNKNIVGSDLTSVEVDDVTRDLILTLSNGTQIQTFTYFVDTDVWEFRRADGFRFGIQSGLEVFERWEEPDKDELAQGQADHF